MFKITLFQESHTCQTTLCLLESHFCVRPLAWLPERPRKLMMRGVVLAPQASWLSWHKPDFLGSPSVMETEALARDCASGAERAQRSAAWERHSHAAPWGFIHAFPARPWQVPHGKEAWLQVLSFGFANLGHFGYWLCDLKWLSYFLSIFQGLMSCPFAAPLLEVVILRFKESAPWIL